MPNQKLRSFSAVKSFAVVKRNLVFYFAGEIVDIPVKEGQLVNKDDTLVTYKLDRESVMHVQTVLYPEQVLSLRKSLVRPTD